MEELPDISGLLSKEAQIAVYRILQECLTNAVRHGKVTRVQVRGSGGDGMICFSCEDNGIGFDPAAVRTQPDGERGLGLASMEERVNLLQGSFELDSIPGQGTRISVTLPLDNEQL